MNLQTGRGGLRLCHSSLEMSEPSTHSELHHPAETLLRQTGFSTELRGSFNLDTECCRDRPGHLLEHSHPSDSGSVLEKEPDGLGCQTLQICLTKCRGRTARGFSPAQRHSAGVHPEKAFQEASNVPAFEEGGPQSSLCLYSAAKSSSTPPHPITPQLTAAVCHSNRHIFRAKNKSTHFY